MSHEMEKDVVVLKFKRMPYQGLRESLKPLTGPRYPGYDYGSSEIPSQRLDDIPYASRYHPPSK